MYHKILLSFSFFQQLKNIKTILSSQAIQKQLWSHTTSLVCKPLSESTFRYSTLLVIKQVQPKTTLRSHKNDNIKGW